MIKKENLREIGRFAKPHGTKGEISLLTDFDLAGIAGEIYIVCDIDGIWVPFYIHSFRKKNASTTLVTFDKLDSVDKVKFLTGKTVFIPSEYLPSENKHLRFYDEIIGYKIIDEHLGLIGVLINVDQSTPNILLFVDTGKKEILIPESFVHNYAFAASELYVSLPDGFLDI